MTHEVVIPIPFVVISEILLAFLDYLLILTLRNLFIMDQGNHVGMLLRHLAHFQFIMDV